MLAFVRFDLSLLFTFWQEDGLGAFKRVWSWLNHPFTIGNFSISATSLTLGALTMLVAFIISRSACSLLRRRLERRKNLDPGLQYTLLRLIHYFIITIGVLLAFKLTFNADLTTLAVLFTALSVGIGFGLQYIAGDIASGFILLFERPVRINDFITVASDARGELQGRVQSINLRTTSVVTNDRLAVIVPNSKLVNQTVVNWSYGDRRTGISIPIGVAYDSDVELVTRTLLRAAEGIKYLIDDPAPTVQFLQFGDFSLDFRLIVWTANPRRHTLIKSEINYRIWRLFKEAKIEIPFPQQELRLRSGVLPIEVEGGSLKLTEGGEDEEERKAAH
ncbi:MAG: mechanosensitive ion channel [Acidobacteria bacterium]|nr:mechanosensitive ion channel [Acidobacteriota bacterium]